MKVGVIAAFVDYHRRGRHNRGALQPQIGPLLASLLPDWVDLHLVNDAWEDPDWSRDYDLLFISALHSDFDRARQISHYWRRRGAKTVLGGTFATMFPHLAAGYFDAVVSGDAEQVVGRVFEDFRRGALEPHYRAPAFRAEQVPTPRLDRSWRSQRLPLALEASRGCPFRCEFCVLTGIGTRYETRSPHDVRNDVAAAMRQLLGRVSWPRDRLLVFYDNNIGGSFRWLRALCDALSPLGIRWGAALSFNALSSRDLVRRMADSGCCYLYVGLESFNPQALSAMNKTHNVVARTREVVEQAHAHGILVSAGLMISPELDDLSYMQSVPRRLEECALHVPAYICFETPIPGTPLFRRLASHSRAFLPNALLRDFTTYTLVTRPRRERVEAFVKGYLDLVQATYAPRRRLAKVARDAGRLVPAGGWWALALDAAEQWEKGYRPDPGRTYLAGSDRPPPEASRIPLGEGDFANESQWERVMQPWRVTDEAGVVLARWRAPDREPLPTPSVERRLLFRRDTSLRAPARGGPVS